MEIKFALRYVKVPIRNSMSFVIDMRKDNLKDIEDNPYITKSHLDNVESIDKKLKSTLIQLPYNILEGMTVDLVAFNSCDFTDSEINFLLLIQQSTMFADKKYSFDWCKFVVVDLEAKEDYICAWISNCNYNYRVK